MPKNYFSWWILGGFLLLCLSFSLGVYYGYGQGYSDAEKTFKNHEAASDQKVTGTSSSHTPSESENNDRFESVITKKDLSETKANNKSADVPGTSRQAANQATDEPTGAEPAETKKSSGTADNQGYTAPDKISQGAVQNTDKRKTGSSEPAQQTTGQTQSGRRDSTKDNGQGDEAQVDRIASDSQARFTIQVLSSTNQKRTKQRKKDLVDQGYEATLTTEKIKGKVWYRVRVGQFFTKPQAEKLAQSLQQKGIIDNYWIGRISP
jgi:septal ring-binding cell division protein DamX